MLKTILTCVMVALTSWSTALAQGAGTPSEVPYGVNVQIDIDKAKAKKSLLAFPPLQFFGTPASAKNFNAVGGELYRTISNNLTVSTYFQMISQVAFLEDTSKVGLKPVPQEANGFKWDTWRQIGAEFLIRGGYNLIRDDLSLEIYAYNVKNGNLVLGKRYNGKADQARRIAHTFSNDLMQAMTGTKGMFLSRMVFTSDRGGGGFREVYIMDWDGANIEKLSNHRTVSLSPAISFDGKRIAYSAMVQMNKTKQRNTNLFTYELATEKRTMISFRPGINSGAAFLPGSTDMFMTISNNGSPDIYRIREDGSIATRITNGPRGAMNVEPTISPDGKRLAFSSDRSGQPMIYTSSIDGTNPKRLTFAGRYNATPAWSPDGQRIAFAGWENNHFDIFTMKADGTDMVRITSARKPNGKWANNEDPSYSPDGRFLVYSSNRTGTYQIYISNLDGSEERRITNDSFNYFKPRWSINIE